MKRFLLFFSILILIPQLGVDAQGIKNQSNQKDHYVTSSAMSFLVRGNQTKTFHFKELKKKAFWKPSRPVSITMELASDPIWFVIQSLPYLIDNQNGSTIDLINGFFANSVALYLLNKEIGLDNLMQKWEQEKGNSDETKMHNKIGQIFDTVLINKRMSDEISILQQSQLSDGSWPWFPGMKGSRYITQVICCGIGRLFDMHIYDNYSDRLNDVGIPAFKYCDNEMNQDYQNILDARVDLQEDHLSSDIITYLYCRTFWNVPIESKCTKALFYWQKQAWTYWQGLSPLEQAMLVPIFYRQGEDTVYIKTLQRFDKEAIHSDKEGVYWKWNIGNSANKTETQSMILEGYSIMRYPTPDPGYIAGIKQWLLQYKQMDHWATTTATVDAIYALLQKDNDPVLTDKLPQITIGESRFDSTSGQSSGYLRHVWRGDKIKPQLGNIKVDNKTEESAWGDVTMQYYKNRNKDQTNVDGLKIIKKVFSLDNSANPAQWKPMLKAKSLKTGDSLKISIEISADKQLNYIHIHNEFSPLTQLMDTTSGVKQIDGLSYERIVKDGFLDFYLEHLDVQKYVFSYTLAVKDAGNFRKGAVKVEKVY